MRWLVFALLGCAAPQVPKIAVHPVEWNPNKVDVGYVDAVAEHGEDLFVFGGTGLHVLSGGALVNSDASVKGFRFATTIPAADGNGDWVVAVDARGRVFRVRDRSKLDPISGRFGLEKSDVRTVLSMGSSRVAFALDKTIAIVDGDRVARYDYAFTSVACGGGHGAGLADGGVTVFDPFRGVDYRYSIDGEYIAVDSTGRAIVGNHRALWRDEHGKLVLRYRSPQQALRSVAASAENVWFLDGEHLGVLDRGVSDVETNGTLLGSPSGDVWALNGGQLRRFSTDQGSEWNAIGLIFNKSCSACHGPGGSAGLDLSTQSRWDSNREKIQKRVVIEKTMPPKGHDLTDAERASIARFLARKM
jgi:hypothetical protein